jgi:hypothetical protein
VLQRFSKIIQIETIHLALHQAAIEQQRARRVDQHFKPRQITGVEMEQAGGAAGRGGDVAEGVEPG